MVLNELIFYNFHFGRVLVVLKGLILDYLQILHCQINTYGVAVSCLAVYVHVCVSRISYMAEVVAGMANDQLSKCNQAALSVLASLSSVYSFADHAVDASEVIFCI